MSGRWFVACVACLAAGLVGFLLGGLERATLTTAKSMPPVVPERADAGARPVAELGAPRESNELSVEVAGAVGAGLAIGLDNPIAAMASLLEIDNETVRSEAGFELVGRMSGAELRALITGIASADEGSPGAKIMNGLFDNIFTPIAMFDRWVELDPDGVAEFSLSPIPDVGKETSNVSMVLRGLSLTFVAQRDPQRAFEIVDSMRSSGLFEKMDGMGEEMIETFIGIGIAIADPVAAIRLNRDRVVDSEEFSVDPIFEMAGPHAEQMRVEVMAYPDGEQRDDMLGELYESWGAYDLDAALASASAMPEGGLRDEMLSDAFDGAAEMDPRVAAAALASLPEGDSRDALAEGIISQWARQEPTAALDWARDNLEGNVFSDQLQKAANQLQVEDGARFVEGLSEKARAEFFSAGLFSSSHFVARMAREDAAAAFAWLSKMGGLDPSGGQGEVFAIAAAAGGIEQAIAASDSLPDGEFRDDFIRTVAYKAGREGGVEALAWAQGEGDQTYTRALQGWAFEDPEAATEYASREAVELVGKAVAGWAAADAQSAYRWTVETHEGDPQAIAKVLAQSDLLDQWGKQDPGGAAEAMLGFPDELGQESLSKVIGDWANSEPSRASEFIAGRLEDGPLRDAAVSALVSNIKNNSPEEARVWAESISNESRREAVIQSLETR
jgi:hypothetical protein